MKNDKILRIIDANVNRYKEGIRVVEDIVRYIYDNKDLAYQLKSLRHLSIPIDIKDLLSSRDSINDVLKSSTKSEIKRDNLENIILANFKRSQESARVLEEIFKLIDINTSELFKKNRYLLYELEKLVLEL